MPYEDDINSRMAEQSERHYNEVKELKNKIAELEEQNKTFINIMDNQSKAIDIFNRMIHGYIARDEMKSMRKRNIYIGRGCGKW